MVPILESVDLRDAESVERALRAGAEACLHAKCRRGSMDVIDADAISEDADEASRTLIATGDLHDNPLHLARLVMAAGMSEAGATRGISHLTLHELIHGDRLVNGADFSFRVLARVAVLKAAYPEHVHVLLANHEIAQLTGSPVAKAGVKCNEAFDEALEIAFGDAAGLVRNAVREFIRAMPLALRIENGVRAGVGDDSRRAILCAHSLPPAELMERFDPGVLGRSLTDEDYVSRKGSAHIMTWGRGLTPEHVERLSAEWGVGLFVLGHEHAEDGAFVVSDRAVVLNSDHERGVYARVGLARVGSAGEVVESCVLLSGS